MASHPPAKSLFARWIVKWSPSKLINLILTLVSSILDTKKVRFVLMAQTICERIDSDVLKHYTDINIILSLIERTKMSYNVCLTFTG